MLGGVDANERPMDAVADADADKRAHANANERPGTASSRRGDSRSSIPPSTPYCETNPGFDCLSSGQLSRSLYR